MSEPQDQTEAACGGSALTAELGALADQFECHALSRSIDDIEAAGRAMRAAMTEIERLRDALQKHDAWLGQAHCLCSDMGIPHGHIEDRLFEAIGKVPNDLA